MDVGWPWYSLLSLSALMQLMHRQTSSPMHTHFFDHVFNLFIVCVDLKLNKSLNRPTPHLPPGLCSFNTGLVEILAELAWKCVVRPDHFEIPVTQIIIIVSNLCDTFQYSVIKVKILSQFDEKKVPAGDLGCELGQWHWSSSCCSFGPLILTETKIGTKKVTIQISDIVTNCILKWREQSHHISLIAAEDPICSLLLFWGTGSWFSATLCTMCLQAFWKASETPDVK